MLARTAPAAPAVALPQGPIEADLDCTAMMVPLCEAIEGVHSVGVALSHQMSVAGIGSDSGLARAPKTFGERGAVDKQIAGM